MKALLLDIEDYRQFNRSAEGYDQYEGIVGGNHCYVMDAYREDPDKGLAYLALAMAHFEEPGFLGLLAAGLLEDLLREPEPDLRFVRSFSDVAFGLDVFDKQIVTAKFDPIVRSVLTATLATLADAHEPRASLVGRYIIGEYGPLTLHNVQFTAHAPEMYISPTMSAEMAAQLPAYVEVMLKEPFLEKVGRLFAASLAEKDHLRRYLTGWTALEAFIGGSFKHRYSAIWNQLNADGLHTEVRPLFHDWTKVEEGEYSLADKFTIIAWVLNREDAQTDIRLFKTSKKDRDNIAHGDEVDEESLPISDVRNLLQRYLNLHARDILALGEG